MSSTPQGAVWMRHAVQWARVGPPLRPSEEDRHLFSALVAPALQPGATVGILGVTPELVQLPWPSGVRIQAFDHSPAMVEAVWAPNPAVPSEVCVTRWESLPCADGSLDAAVGDNSLGVLASLGDQEPVLRSLARVLRPGGLLVLRYFVRPDDPESPDAVISDVFSGRVRSFHALKWRVAMTLAETPGFSVAVSDIHRLFERMFPDREQLAAAGGWPVELIDTIDAYAGAPTRFTFSTLDAALANAGPWFQVVDVRRGSYELAERCPVVALRRCAE